MIKIRIPFVDNISMYISIKIFPAILQSQYFLYTFNDLAKEKKS